MGLATLPQSPFSPSISESPLLTAEEFADRYDGQHVELVRGIVEEVPVPKSKLHGKACVRISASLLAYADQHDCGHVIGNDTWIRTSRSPDSVRGPDVFYVSYDKIPKDDSSEDLVTVAPEVVVEVKSPSDSWSKMLAKANEYLAANVLAVLLVNPENSSLTVCKSGFPATHLSSNDNLELPDILPGFTVNVGSLFE